MFQTFRAAAVAAGLAVVLSAPSLFLASCATSNVNNAQVAQAARDVAAIAGALEAELPALQQAGVPADTVAKVSTYVADLQTVSSALSTATTQAAAQPLVQRVESDVNAVLAAVNGLAIPGTPGAVLRAAAALLPVIEAAVNLVVAPAAAPATMTPDAARTVLNAAAHR